MTDHDEICCISCGGSDPRCAAYHPEYGFTCILPPHNGPHYDAGGGHWDVNGQLFLDDPVIEIRRAQRLVWANKLAKGFNTTECATGVLPARRGTVGSVPRVTPQ